MSEISKRIKQGFSFLIDSEWKAFFVCLSIATLLWFFQSMGQNYIANIKIDINFVNLPEDKAIADDLPSAFDVDVRGQGWDLLAYKFQINKPEFNIDLGNIGSQKKYSATLARDLIKEQVSGLTEILSIKPEEFELNLEPALRKMVPIKPRGIIKCSPGFGINGMAVTEPDSVEIWGPKSLVKNIKMVETELYSYENRSENIEEIVSLQTDSIPYLSFNLKKVTLTASVEKLTRKELQIPVRVVGYKGNKKVNLIPQIVTVSFQTTLTNYAKVDKKDFNVFVQFENGALPNVELLEVQVTTNTDLISNLRVQPKSVNYFLEN